MSQAIIEVRSRSTPNPWVAFAVIAVAIYLTILDLYIVNVAIHAIAADFSGADISSLSWVLTAYAVAFSAVLVPAGKLGDLYGRRRLFSIGLLLFVAGSALSAAAASLPLLVLGRIIQAVGAGAMTPNSLGLALSLFPSALVFTDTTGEPVHPHSLSQAFERNAAGTEVPAIRLHDLRHTNATLLTKAGVPVKVVSAGVARSPAPCRRHAWDAVGAARASKLLTPRIRFFELDEQVRGPSAWRRAGR